MVKKIFLIICFTGIILYSQAQDAPDSSTIILEKAFSKAKAENKNVFVIFHASWCGWCKKMDAAMNDAACKKFFDDNYVTQHLRIQETYNNKDRENPGAEELFAKYAPENSGIPFWLVFNGKTKELIGDAKMPDGSNAGCPAAKAEVQHFIAVLKKSSKLNDNTEKIIYSRFRKNEQNQKH